MKTRTVIIVFLFFGAALMNGQVLKPLDILTKANEECKKIKSIEYICRIESEDNSGSIIPVLEATVTQMRLEVKGKNFLPGLFRVKGSMNNSNGTELNYLYDGKAFKIDDKENNKIHMFENPKQGDLFGILGPGMYAGLPNLLRDNPYDGYFKYLDSIKQKEDVEIFGEQCYTIEFYRKDTAGVTGGGQIVNTWYFSRKDFLPRGNSGNTMIPLTTTIKIIKMNSDIRQKDFDTGFIGTKKENPPAGNGKNKGMLELGAKAPDFSLKGIDDKIHTLSEYGGKTKLILFFTSMIDECKSLMNSMQKLYEKYKTNDFEIIRINAYDESGKAELFMKNNNYTFISLLAGEKVAEEYKAAVFPAIYLVSRDEIILHAEYGFRVEAEAEIERLLLKELGRNK